MNRNGWQPSRRNDGSLRDTTGCPSLDRVAYFSKVVIYSAALVHDPFAYSHMASTMISVESKAARRNELWTRAIELYDYICVASTCRNNNRRDDMKQDQFTVPVDAGTRSGRIRRVGTGTLPHVE